MSDATKPRAECNENRAPGFRVQRPQMVRNSTGALTSGHLADKVLYHVLHPESLLTRGGLRCPADNPRLIAAVKV